MSFPKTWPNDITKGDIQTYLQHYYMSSNAPKHQPLVGIGNRCKNNTSDDNLSLPQSVVHSVMKGIAETNSSNRGLLVWHSTGSGKTLTGTCVMDSFWETDKNIVFVTSVEASNSNPPSNFHKLASRFLPRFKGKSLDVIKREFDKRGVKFFTFATLAHYLLIANPLKSVKSNADIQKHKSFLSDAIIIIDEVHNIFKPLPNQKTENDAVKRFLTMDNNPLTQNLKIAILTATPGDTLEDIVELLNLVRDKNNPVITCPDINNKQDIESFKTNIKGLVSFFDMSKDYTKFPRVTNAKVVRAPMNVKQYIRYSSAYNEEPDAIKNADLLLKQNQIGKYYKHARRYANMLYDMDSGMLLEEFSSKLPSLLKSIQEYPKEKHYIYSSFYENRGYGGHGILAIAKALEEHLGFEKVSVSQAKELISKRISLSAKPRYVIAISSDLSDDKEKLKSLVSAFNMAENSRGEYIQLFLASQGYNEGVDLRAVKHVHIFEPLLTFASDKQTIGRAARYCSHSNLNLEQGEWTVKIHRYISDKPTDLSIFNLNYLRERTHYFIQWSETLQQRYDALPPLKELKQKRNDLQGEIKKIMQMIRELQKKTKQIEKMNLKNVEMIDEKITNEALARTRELMVVYAVIKEASVDYLLFKDFHASNFV